MDNKDEEWTKISYTSESTFGKYDLAERLRKVTYTNEKVWINSQKKKALKNKTKQEKEKEKEKEKNN